MSIKNFKNYLKTQDSESLRDELLALYKKFEPVREFYAPRVEPANVDKVIEKYKKVLAKQFWPQSNRDEYPELNYSVARKAISDFKKVNSIPHAIIDLQLTYVEYGVRCTLEYGDIDARFYNSMESMFHKTLKDAYEMGLLDSFKERCLKIQENTKDMGWDFGGTITELCEKYFAVQRIL